MRLCSACLLGIECRYDGKSNRDEKVLELAKKEVLIPVCPEQLGGLSTPRTPAERRGDKVVSKKGEDFTDRFVKGAEITLQIARIFGVEEAILKQKSPSCGSGITYDGTFSHSFVERDGVTAEVLKKNGINVISEEEL